jgi:hypothetical protein
LEHGQSTTALRASAVREGAGAADASASRDGRIPLVSYAAGRKLAWRDLTKPPPATTPVLAGATSRPSKLRLLSLERVRPRWPGRHGSAAGRLSGADGTRQFTNVYRPKLIPARASWVAKSPETLRGAICWYLRNFERYVAKGIEHESDTFKNDVIAVVRGTRDARKANTFTFRRNSPRRQRMSVPRSGCRARIRDIVRRWHRRNHKRNVDFGAGIPLASPPK